MGFYISNSYKLADPLHVPDNFLRKKYHFIFIPFNSLRALPSLTQPGLLYQIIFILQY